MIYLIPGGFHVNRFEDSRQPFNNLVLQSDYVPLRFSRPLSEMESVKTDVSVCTVCVSILHLGHLSRLLHVSSPFPDIVNASEKHPGYKSPSAGPTAEKPVYRCYVSADLALPLFVRGSGNESTDTSHVEIDFAVLHALSEC